jgi:hypothetical protein
LYHSFSFSSSLSVPHFQIAGFDAFAWLKDCSGKSVLKFSESGRRTLTGC